MLGVISQTIGPQLTFWVPAGFTGAATLVALFLFTETLDPEMHVRPTLRRATPLGSKQANWNDTELGLWQSLIYGSSALGLAVVLPMAMRALPLNWIVLISLASTA
eukprot:gene32651-58615_t